MKKALVLVVVITITIGLWVVLKKPKNPVLPAPVASDSPAATTVSGNTSPAPAATNTTPSTPTVVPPVSIPGGSPPTINAAATPSPAPGPGMSSLPPLTVLDNARVAIHNYQDRFGENPVGNNAEITAALMGNNPKQLNFITGESGLRVNDKGEMVDAYGTPFFFHQISGKLMEIHSAGEDQKMWTDDDQVTR